MLWRLQPALSNCSIDLFGGELQTRWTLCKPPRGTLEKEAESCAALHVICMQPCWRQPTCQLTNEGGCTCLDTHGTFCIPAYVIRVSVLVCNSAFHL